MKNLFCLIAAFGVCVGGWASVDAAELEYLPSIAQVEFQDDAEQLPPTGDYQSLLERLEAAEAQIEELRLKDYSGMMEDDARGPPTAVDECLAPAPTPTWPNVKLGGFFHLDAGTFDQDALNMALFGDIENGVGFRRTRLLATGSVAEFTNFTIEMDYAQAGRPSFQDVWGEQTHLPFFGNVRIGQYRQPLTMDSWTSIRSLWFLERALPFHAFDPFRRVGIMAYDKSCDENWSWAYSIYRTGGFNNQPLGDGRYGTDIGDNDGVSVCGRLTHLLWYDEATEGRSLLHVGGSANYSLITGGTPTGDSYQARAIPEFFVGDPAAIGPTANGTPFFADTGRLAADAYQFYNGQLAGQSGPAHFQAEYMFVNVEQIGAPNVQYDGAYAQCGYFLTGEHLTYNRLYGVFDKVVPYNEFFGVGRHQWICGWGAWEVTARWSFVDLEDPNAVPIAFSAGPPPSPNPGELTNYTLGVNWYWNAYAKMQFNYIHCNFDSTLVGENECNIVCGRFQVAF